MRRNPYILPKIIKPIKYYIELSPNLETLNFNGKENIEIKILKNTKKIIINSKGIKINKVEIKQKNILRASKIIYNSIIKNEGYFIFDQVKEHLIRVLTKRAEFPETKEIRKETAELMNVG